MLVSRILILTGLGFLAGYVAYGQTPDKSLTLEVTEEAGSYVLAVPVSRLVVKIPKENLSRGQTALGGSTASPRYFLFEDPARHLVVSGWFESAHGYSGLKKSWDEEIAAWKVKNLPAPQDVSFENVGSWTAVLYDISDGGVTSSHIRAHWVQAGTWLDLHISLTAGSASAERRARVREVLRAVQVSEKKS